jgi:spore coat polysaccharide biosynthesis protein SpsF
VSVGLIIFSRLDSRRLPGKALLPVAGKPLLGRVIERASLIANIQKMVVATSDRPVDDEIATYAQTQGVEVFRGDAEDVRSRAIACCEKYKLSFFGRICGDSPMLSPGLWSEALDLAASQEYDLVTNTFPRSFPVGMSVEVFSVAALRQSQKVSKEIIAMEHIGHSFYSAPDQFKIKNLSCNEGDYSDAHIAVDTQEDLNRIGSLIGVYGDRLLSMSLEEITRAVSECSKSKIVHE